MIEMFGMQIIHHVVSSQPFLDDFFFYRFQVSFDSSLFGFVCCFLFRMIQ